MSYLTISWFHDSKNDCWKFSGFWVRKVTRQRSYFWNDSAKSDQNLLNKKYLLWSKIREIFGNMSSIRQYVLWCKYEESSNITEQLMFLFFIRLLCYLSTINMKNTSTALWYLTTPYTYIIHTFWCLTCCRIFL